MLDPAPTGVGTGRLLLGRMEQIRVVVIGRYGSKLSVPISGLGTLKLFESGG